jgi:hypothetical protein
MFYNILILQYIDLSCSTIPVFLSLYVKQSNIVTVAAEVPVIKIILEVRVVKSVSDDAMIFFVQSCRYGIEIGCGQREHLVCNASKFCLSNGSIDQSQKQGDTVERKRLSEQLTR